MIESETERAKQKIMREAHMIMQARDRMRENDDILERLDEYSERFKDTMKAKFESSFVSSGAINTGKKEATVTFIKKSEQSYVDNQYKPQTETIALSDYKPLQQPVQPHLLPPPSIS